MKHGYLILACAALCRVTLSVAALAQAPYDGVQAGLEAFRLGEEQRRAKVAMQLEVNDQVKAWAGLPTSRGETIYYGTGPVFGPWPYVTGDIFGYRYYPPLRQPIGQRQVQTGPNRWESHPVYARPLVPYRPLPPVASPLLEKTPFAEPAVATGPREF